MDTKYSSLGGANSEIETVTDVPCVSKERVEIEADGTPARNAGRAAILTALFCTYVIWGSTYLGMRIALEGFPPFLMAGIRFVISGALLYGLLRVRGAGNPSRAAWGGAALVGALLLGGGNGGVVFAEQWVASGLAALGVATVPLWAALFAGLWGQWPARREWLGLGVGFAGMALFSTGGDLRANPAGLIALLVSAVCWAFGSVWSRRLPMPGGMMASATQMLTGGGVLLLLGLVHGERLPHAPGPRPLLAMAYLIFGAVVAFSAYVYLLKRVRPALATSNAYVNPVIAVMLGALVAGEHLSGTEIGALVLILTGVGLLAAVKQNEEARHHVRLYIIRHAEPDYPNKTITAAGHLEAAALAERLAADGISRIFCSPLGRAVHTMEYTARRLRLEPTIAPWTAELPTNDTDAPPWGRMPVWDIPGEVLRGRPLRADDQIDCEPSLDLPHVREIYARIERDSDAFLAGLDYVREGKRYRVVRPSRDRIAMFCHGGFGLTWLAHLLELPLPLVWSGFWLAPSSVTTIILEQRSEDWAVPRCLALGDTSHLHTAGLPLSPMGQYALNW